jgi:hypothetical protein
MITVQDIQDCEEEAVVHMDILDDYPNVNRVEVIDSKGRVYINYGATDVRISIQNEPGESK